MGQAGIDTGWIGAAVLVAILLLAMKTMFGRAAFPILAAVLILVSASMLPNDPVARQAAAFVFQLGVPFLVLWLVYDLFVRPIVAPHDRRTRNARRW